MEVDEATPGMQPSSNGTGGAFTTCEVKEQQAARVEVQDSKGEWYVWNQKKSKTTCVKLWPSVRKKQMRWALCQVL